MYLRKDKMKVLVFGNKEWSDYNEFIRQITVLLDDRKHWNPDDKEYIFIHQGGRGAENMVTEYVGKVYKLLKSNGYKIKEELIRDRSEGIEESLILSGVDFALVFGKSHRTNKCIAYLELYGVPYRFIQ